MKHNEGSFQGSGGIALYTQNWCPDEPSRASLAVVHGLGEHSGRYLNIVKHFVPVGYAVYGFDHRGHGRSLGRRGYINNWTEFRQDVRAFVEMIARQEPDRPLFLMGHSLGGLIVLEYGLHYPDLLRGVIASAPALNTAGISPILLTMSRILSLIWPTLSINTGLDVTNLSRDPTVVADYKADPLVHGKGTPRLGVAGPAAIRWTHEHAANWQVPLLILHGEADRLTSASSSRAFFDKITYPDKTYIAYKDGYHESHNDIHYEQVMADIQRWLEAHL